jgi:hypothetical protein
MLVTILLIAFVLLVLDAVTTGSRDRQWEILSKRLPGTGSSNRGCVPVRGPYLIGVRASQSSAQLTPATVKTKLLPDSAWEWQKYGRDLPATSAYKSVDIIP